MNARLVAWLAGAALGLSGCAAGGGAARAGGAAVEEPGEPQAASAFPAPEELSAIAKRPPPPRIFEPAPPDVASWKVEQGPDRLPAQVEHAPQGFWEGLLADQAARRGGAVRLTEPMACLARLAGQYALEKQAPPGQGTLEFLAARCAVADPRIGYSFVFQPLRGAETDDQVQQHMRPAAEQALARALAGGRLDAGIWFGRQKQRAVAMLVHAQPMARLEAVPSGAGPDGHVVLRGELLRGADHVDALINHGRYGFRRCAVDRSVALPRFAVDCEVDPADESEVLEIAAFAPRRVMGPIVLRITLWPAGKVPAARRQPAAPARPGTAPRELAAGLVASLNQVRAAAGLAPVALAPSQSGTAVLLAPHYFTAESTHQADQVDAIAVGVMAGWQVDGRVRAGHFTSGWTADAASEGGLIAGVLERPSGREALLDPDIRAVAVGAVREEGRLGAVFGTYAFLEVAPPGAEAAALVRRIDVARAKRGLPPTQALESMSREVAEISLSVERGERSSGAAMQAVLDSARRAAASGRVYSWSGYGDRLDSVELPEQLLSAPAIRVAVGVAHCKPRGSPWFGYCVLMGAVQQSVTASAEPPAQGVVVPHG